MNKKLVYLTHTLNKLSNPSIHIIFRELMFSVVPVYKNPSAYFKIRKIFDRNKIAYDSGGFSFLMGRLKNPDPLKTIRMYKTVGFEPDDFLFQLDLPPSYHLSKEQRISLIKKSAEFYHRMKAQINNIIPIVHGWSMDELSLSLQLIESDTLGLGSYAATSTGGGTTIGVGAFVATNRKYSGPKHNHELDFQYRYSGRRKVITTSVATFKEKKQYTPAHVIYQRLAVAMNLLRSYRVFLLGASDINMLHLAFLLGANFSDGSSWRIAARFWTVFIPERGRVSFGIKNNARKPTEEDIRILREVYRDENYILNNIPFDDLLSLFKAHKKVGFITRALHNAYVTKIEEQIANEFVNDPDRYYAYLNKRWENNNYWRKRLNFVWRYTKQPYVQDRLITYLRS